MKPDTIFSDQEIETIRAAITVALGEDPVLPHWEFHTLTGVSVEDGLNVLERWPDVDIDRSPEWHLVWGVIGRLRGYPHKQKQRVFAATGLTKKEDFTYFLDKLRPFEPT